MLDLLQLRAFLEVAERGTIADAAVALSYSPPAVSQQISKLERELATPLFDRVGGRLRLNEAGIQLTTLAREMLDLAEHATFVVSSSPTDGRVVVAGFASALRALVIPVLPDAIGFVDIREMEDDDALRELSLGHVDVAIVQEYDGLPVARSDRFTYSTLLRDRLRLVAPPSRSRSVTLAQLGDDGWLTNGSGTRCEQATALILARAGISPTITGNITDNATLLALVSAGHGATIVPELVLADGVGAITVASQDLRVKRTISAVTRKAVTKRHRTLLRQLASFGKQAAVG
jgi:DNA-binding transcriptional LysR family regulator